jgi:two-component system sensor histidine kinase BaeS
MSESAASEHASTAAVAAASPANRTRRSLAFRLGLVLAVTVVAVLLLVGVVVNRVVSSSYETVLTDLQQQRLDDAAQTVADRLARPAGPARAQAFVMRLANQLGGEVRVISVDGTTLAAFGRAPDDAVRYETPIQQDGQTVATLQADVPARGGDRGFLRLFNITLIVAGIISVLGIVLVATWIAGRLTRPLHDVSDAARRLEAGDSTARASGGDDRESAELATAFNAMADRLERSEMLRRRAASDIAHDLATPATVLESQLQAMIDGVVPTDPANLEAARSTAAALGGVVADIDDLARAEAAPLHARPQAVDLAIAIPEVAAALDGQRRARDARLDTTVGTGTTAWADPGHLARAMRNVVANAIAHSPTGGTVTIAAQRIGRSVEIRVEDQGPGIAPADVEHVFERFYRADTARAIDPSTGRPTGLGLGLTIARELLAANGGRIAVERTGPGGTTFLLEIPAAD